MDLKEKLASGHSKKITLEIARYAAADKTSFAELVSIFLNSEYRITQRAAWPLAIAAIEQPSLVLPHMAKLMKRLGDETQHPSVQRNILRIFQEIEIPERYTAEVFDHCCRFISSETVPVAVRAFAITVASNITRRYPDLMNELTLLFRQLSETSQTPAIRVRIKSALKPRR